MGVEKIHKLIDSIFTEHLSKTQEFLRIPTIFPENVGLVKAADWLKEYIEGLYGQVELVGNKQAPIVYARFDLGREKTILVYGMYDVHPTSGQVWTSPPFAAHIRDVSGIGPCIIARGACNSKGPLMGFLNAMHAIRQLDEFPVNLILTIEGEEEIGSPTLPLFYEQNKAQLKAHAGFEPFWAEYGTDVSKPTLSLGTKGVVELDLICRGGEWGGPVEYPIHSSVAAWLASPSWRLINALSTLVGEDEEIRINGFYEQVVPPRPEDEKLLERLESSFDEKEMLSILGARRFKYNLHGIDLLRKYLFSPTLHVSVSPQADDGVVSPVSRARLMIRLVPEMDPIQTVKKVQTHLGKKGFKDIEVLVRSSYPWSRTSIDTQVVQAMIETYKYHGVEPQILPISSSATPYYLFSQVLGIPYVWGGLGRAGRSHAPDEFASVEGLRLFEKSIVTFLHKFASS